MLWHEQWSGIWGLFTHRWGWHWRCRELKEGTTAALEDAAASIEAHRAGAALVELETEGVSYGDVGLWVAVRGSAEQLEQWGAPRPPSPARCSTAGIPRCSSS